MRVVVLIDYSNSSFPVPANHDSNQSMLTASIAAEECRMQLFVIVDQATVKAEFGLFRCELSNVFLASQRNVFMTARLFKLRNREVFFLAIQEQLIQCNYALEGLFLLDQSGSSDTHKSVKTFAERTTTSSSWFHIPQTKPNYFNSSHLHSRRGDSRGRGLSVWLAHRESVCSDPRGMIRVAFIKP
jgi:hypothetical protein